MGTGAARAAESAAAPQGVLGALPELADALAGEVQPVGNVLEALGAAAVEAVADHEHGALAFGQPSPTARSRASRLAWATRFARVSSSGVGLGSSTTSRRLMGRVPLAGLYHGAGASRLAGSTGAVRTSSTWVALRPRAAAASGREGSRSCSAR